MADNPGIGLQFFGNRELTVKTFTRPGTIVPSFVPPVIGYHLGGDQDDPAVTSGIGKAIVTQPVRSYSSPGSAKGILIEGFYDLFWKNRVHILGVPVEAGSVNSTYDEYAAGNVVTAVENSFEIYNSGEGMKRGQIREMVSFAFNPTGQNITILSGTTTAFILGARESEVYTYRIEADGTVNIVTDIEIDFRNGDQLIHHITGSRVLPFTLIPQQGIKENWSWLTDIITAQSGREQRNSLRAIPRQTFTYVYRYNDAADDRNIKLENFVWNNTPARIAVPVFIDGTELSADVTTGDTVLNVVSTSNRDFRSGSDGAYMIFQDEDTFEVQQITSFTATTITGGITLNSWPAGTKVYPIRFCQISQPMAQRAWAINAREMAITWRPTSNVEYTGEAGFPVYQSLPVWDEDWVTPGFPMRLDWRKSVDYVESGTGVFFADSLRDFPTVTAEQLFDYPDRTELWRIKRWLMSRRGQQKAFWMSTRRPDMKIGLDNVAGTTLDIQNFGYSVNVFAKDLKGLRKDIEILYVDGSVNYRRITSATDNGATEGLVLDSAASQALSAANVARISYLKAWRLNTDDLEFVHQWPNRGFVVIPIIEATYT